ncbi:NAD(+) synthase [Spirosoma utsteinense]|uniref:Glutamine-dependent NAD(+) synthetase n=1 Tax=Spirosoma utsteinense TaxID=2585773 RepID=A0ABR6W2A0_9BACT|nr:NAD(+) synthase [Spirosoma utsteinense]MBC3786489.1 NAD+ synthase (glutamine-hydrolyzing) [Spirosoma utsteinense]MBC3789865.1 NAD+ synthase (glutamine-hydrolyzing) [Spirosoma utsteinense]
MKLLKVAAGVLNQIPLAWEHNKQNIINAIEEAQRQDVNLLCLPELCISGYGCEDAFYAQSTIDQSIASLLEIVEHTNDIAVAVGLALRHNNRIYDVACLIANKRILGFAVKQYMANNGLHYEARWFQPWQIGLRDETRIGEFSYPFGDIVFDLSGIRIGFEICEDAWIANRPGRALYERGVDIILNPSASHFGFFKSQIRERFVVDASRAFGVSYVYTNMLGNEAGRVIFDGDAMVASNGELLVSGARLSYHDFVIVPAVVDVEATRLSQVQNRGNLALTLPNLRVVERFDWPDIAPVIQKAELEAWERGGYLKEEEFARAVALGLFDYLRKSRSQGYVLSLSGGADSSAIAATVYLMIRMAVENLGIEGVKKKLSYIKALQTCDTPEAMMGKLLTVMYQGTENSSDDTFNSAKELADDIGATFLNININGLVETYTGLIEAQLGRKLSWDTDDLALQNIQARVRAPSIWMLANINNALLLSTSNRSEAAVGYATMDGDTAGSISPITGIDKHFLRGWLRWLETVGLNVKNAPEPTDRTSLATGPIAPDELIKVKGLYAVNNLQPTAELRPLDKKQTDEDDLMPYDVLNTIELAAIRDKQPPIEVLKLAEVHYAGVHDREKLLIWVERFFKLWSRNQWKRERYAPSFHLDDHNLDPRSWMRFPILSGGYEKELDEMKSWANEQKPNGRKGKIGF